MTNESKGDVGHVPVYMSRYSADRSEGYGAFIAWNVGERVTVLSKHGRPAANVTIASETKSHDSAPMIHGARGYGRWVREVVFDGETSPCAISEAQIVFGTPPAPAQEGA